MNFSASTFTETSRALQLAAADASADQAQSRSLLVFHLGERAYGLAIEHVVQIIAMVKLTPVPQAEQVIEGVANIRGKIVPVLSARRHLGLPLVAPQLYTPIILLQTDGRTIGLIVDEVADVIRLSAGQMTGTEAILPVESESTGVLEGVVNHGESVVMVINPHCLLNPAAMRALKRETDSQPEPASLKTSAKRSRKTPASASGTNGDSPQAQETPAVSQSQAPSLTPSLVEPQKQPAGNGHAKSRKGRRNLSETLAGEIAGLAVDLPPTDGQILPNADGCILCILCIPAKRA